MTDSNDLESLFADAQTEGLSKSTATVLVNNLNDLTTAGAQGTAIDDLAGDEAVLYVRIIDKSSSMHPHTTAVIEAANDQITALDKSKAAQSLLMSTWFFNERPHLVHSYVMLGNVVQLDHSNYQPNGSTALFDTVLSAITSLVAYTQTLQNAGIRVKVVIVIMSDGEDNQSRATASQLRSIIEDLLRQEIYTFAFVGFGMDAKAVATSMGIPDANVLDEKADAHSIRHAFATVSQSVIRASQTVIGAPNSSSFFS